MDETPKTWCFIDGEEFEVKGDWKIELLEMPPLEESLVADRTATLRDIYEYFGISWRNVKTGVEQYWDERRRRETGWCWPLYQNEMIRTSEAFRSLAEIIRDASASFRGFGHGLCLATIREDSLELLEILPATAEGDELGDLLVRLAARMVR
jgi:hypothetical protein